MTNPEGRFWSKVDKGAECWLWIGGTTRSGYGQFHVSGGQSDRVRVYAHRWSYEQEFGVIPDGMELDHLCRTRNCVRPSHLEPVTHAENHGRRTGFRTGPYDVGAHCKHGHPRTPENTRINAQGYRECLPCHRAAVRRHRLKSQHP